MEIAAIYFPGFHRDDHNDAWFGEGFNEWQLMARARPRFPGHTIRQPAWGYFDEADPHWMARQISAAADHGVDIFLFDWYWYSGVKILHRPLEEGFLHAENRERLRFALMWANHDWQHNFPAPAPADGTPQILLPIRHSAGDFERVIAHAIDRYFHQLNYWRVDGALYFSIFEPRTLIEGLGGTAKARAVLDRARAQVREAGLGDLHMAAFAWNAALIPECRAAGFDSLTTYTVGAAGTLPDQPIEDYSDTALRHEALWTSMDSGDLPYAPVVSTGWDTTPRWAEDAPWPPPEISYPYSPLAVNATPRIFGDLVRKALAHVEHAKLRPPAIVINAWNEWTESSAILPDNTYGWQYLETLRDSLRPAPDHP